MKVKRQKHLKKVLAFYKQNFGYQPPYHVLVDGTFCKAALRFQVNIIEQIPKYFDCEVKLYTTKCVLQECIALGSLLYGPLKLLQQYTLLSCGHKDPMLPGKCISKTVKRQKQKLIVATQDSELSDSVRGKQGVPLLYISHNAINMEAPSSGSVHTVSEKTKRTVAPTEKQAQMLEVMKRAVFGEPENMIKKKKRKGPKGPNPLSCKKKKSKQAGQGSTAKTNFNGTVSEESTLAKTSKKKKKQKKKKKRPKDSV